MRHSKRRAALLAPALIPFSAAMALAQGPRPVMTQEQYDWQLTNVCQLSVKGSKDDSEEEAYCNHVRFSVTKDSGNIGFGYGDPQSDATTRIVMITEPVASEEVGRVGIKAVYVFDGKEGNYVVPSYGFCSLDRKGSMTVSKTPLKFDYLYCGYFVNKVLYSFSAAFRSFPLESLKAFQMFRR